MLFISDPEDFWRSRRVILPRVCPGVCHPAGVKCPVVRFPKVSRFYLPPPPSTAVKVSQEWWWDTCPKESDSLPMLWINIVVKVWQSALHSSTINLPVSFTLALSAPYLSNPFSTHSLHFLPDPFTTHCQYPCLSKNVSDATSWKNDNDTAQIIVWWRRRVHFFRTS